MLKTILTALPLTLALSAPTWAQDGGDTAIPVEEVEQIIDGDGCVMEGGVCVGVSSDE